MVPDRPHPIMKTGARTSLTIEPPSVLARLYDLPAVTSRTFSKRYSVMPWPAWRRSLGGERPGWAWSLTGSADARPRSVVALSANFRGGLRLRRVRGLQGSGLRPRDLLFVCSVGMHAESKDQRSGEDTGCDRDRRARCVHIHARLCRSERSPIAVRDSATREAMNDLWIQRSNLFPRSSIPVVMKSGEATEGGSRPSVWLRLVPLGFRSSPEPSR